MKTVFPSEVWDMASPESQQVNPAGLADALDHLRSISGSDGISQTLVIHHGRMIWRGEHADSWHNIFSCTKSALSLTAGLLIDDGKISLESRLCDWIPSLKALYSETTVRHCLSLTCGYAPAESDPFAPAAPLFQDRRAFHYSNTAFNVLALALTRAGGEPLDALFKRRIADPIGIDDRWIWGETGTTNGLRVNGGGGDRFKGVHTSAENMARVGLLLLNKGRWNSQQLLSEDWIAQASRPQAPADLPLHDPNGWYKKLSGAYGFGFWINSVRADGTQLWPDAPAGTFAMQGNLNNICVVIPDWDLVLVRMGTDQLINPARYTEVFARLKTALLN